MARFKYLGEVPVPYVASFGPTTVIKLKTSDGSIRTVLPPPPATAFAIGSDIGVDIIDVRTLRLMRVDPRFQEII